LFGHKIPISLTGFEAGVFLDRGASEGFRGLMAQGYTGIRATEAYKGL